uniref:Odorant receptor n=1 Tax=Phyllotreta striolata TaxID=444603 RepID=B2ZDZ6_PHYSR|nr:odorant receptor [Phyllotreta striolata]
MMKKVKVTGLVADLMPNIRLMQASGHFMFNYHADNSGVSHLLRKVYSCMHLVLVLIQYACILVNLALNPDDVNELTANTITVLFFTHCITKFVYFAVNVEFFYRTIAVWNQPNSHPLFVESDARYHCIGVMKMRRLLFLVNMSTSLDTIAWTTVTFFRESVANLQDNDTENGTINAHVPRLPIKAFYPWNAESGITYYVTLFFQINCFYFSTEIRNKLVPRFCSWLIFACEQLHHLQAIMKPLMELTASMDTYVPNSAILFRAPSATSHEQVIDNNQKNEELDLKGVYNTRQEMGANFRSGALQNFGQGGGGVGPNGLTKKQELMVRSAIKYWVERHKHVVRLVTAIGDAYGVALLLHMLTSTVMLTLLAYQATKINGVDTYAATVIGYLVYALAQVFHFFIFGNRLIEESSSVMEAAYSCHWYDGSEEAKTFVQIVCQQCQKAMSISGAKFFTISLDLFASVLGATVTYFMVLVQLK